MGEDKGKKPHPDKRGQTVWKNLASENQEFGSGFEFAANVIAGIGLGYLFTKFFPGTKPWGLVGFLLLGAASGFYQLYMQQVSSEKKSPKPKDEKKA